MKPIAALEFSDLFRINDADDGLEVCEEQFGRPAKPDPPHPFEKLFNDTELRTSVEDCGWETPIRAPLAGSSDSTPFSNPLGFSRSSIGYRLGVVRIEQQIIDGECYSTAYNAAGECVESLHVTE